MTTLADAIANPGSVTLTGAANGAKLDTILAAVDGLEALATTLNGYVDQLEGYTDALETLIGSTNTKLDSLITQGSSSAAVPVAMVDEYETVAASQTDQVLGATGATGDRLSGLLIQPGTTSPGTVVLKDGSTTIYTFPGGASSVATLIPFTVPVGLKSVSGAWKVTTGANVTVIGIGDFT
jgi:outer membrane murein-binding lipoprotein Lpp